MYMYLPNKSWEKKKTSNLMEKKLEYARLQQGNVTAPSWVYNKGSKKRKKSRKKIEIWPRIQKIPSPIHFFSIQGGKKMNLRQN